MLDFSNQMANTILETQQRQGKLSHAYLFVGEHEQDAFALYAAQAILCQSRRVGACQECETCMRVASHQHADFAFISGKETSIKKEDILKLQEQFLQTSLESSKHQVYIIEDVDNASVSAMNALLKFLEEPQSQITAILTTSSEQRVLETIQSRCLIIKLKENTQEQLFHDLVEQEYDLFNAYYLSKLFPTLQAIEADKQFNTVMDFTQEFVTHLNKRQLNVAGVKLQGIISRTKKIDRDGFLMFLEILEYSYALDPLKHESIIKFTDSPVNKMVLLEIIIDIKDRLRPGVNLGLLIDQMIYMLSKGALYD